jgi:hypothetical protein
MPPEELGEKGRRRIHMDGCACGISEYRSIPHAFMSSQSFAGVYYGKKGSSTVRNVKLYSYFDWMNCVPAFYLCKHSGPPWYGTYLPGFVRGLGLRLVSGSSSLVQCAVHRYLPGLSSCLSVSSNVRENKRVDGRFVQDEDHRRGRLVQHRIML